jgi:hypothetical protein
MRRKFDSCRYTNSFPGKKILGRIRSLARQPGERGKPPSAKMIGKIELMKRRAPENNDPLHSDTERAGNGAQERQLLRRAKKLCGRQAMDGERRKRR